jgi:hypothetical protein
VWAVALAAGIAGVVIAASTAAAHATSALARTDGVGGVVARLQRSFGDGRIVSGCVDGSLLTVKLVAHSSSDQLTADNDQEKALFEAPRPNYRPWFYEIDDSSGIPQVGASWMPGLSGSTWARPGLDYALAHE